MLSKFIFITYLNNPHIDQTVVYPYTAEEKSEAQKVSLYQSCIVNSELSKLSSLWQQILSPAF